MLLTMTWQNNDNEAKKKITFNDGVKNIKAAVLKEPALHVPFIIISKGIWYSEKIYLIAQAFFFPLTH